MSTTKTTTVTALVLAGVLAVAGCSATPEPDPVLEVTSPTPSQSTDTGDGGVIADPPGQSPEPEPVSIPAAGTTVSAEDVEVLREAGASVYVSPNGDGSGLVLDPASTELPAPVVADIKAASPATPPQTMEEFSQQGLAEQAMNAALEDAGAAAFYLINAPSFGPDNRLVEVRYVVVTYNIPGAREWIAQVGDSRSDTKAGAIANAQSLMDANPGVPLIDTTA